MKRKYLLLLVLLFLVGGYVAMMYLTWSSRTAQKGDALVARLEAWHARHGGYPASLSVLGIPAAGDGYRFKGERFYYDRFSDGTFMLYFLVGPDENCWYSWVLRRWLREPMEALGEADVRLLWQHISGRLMRGAADSLCYESVQPNQKQIRPHGFATPPDSLALVRMYYRDGRLAARGWLLFFHDPETDDASPIGRWTYWTEDGIPVTLDYRDGRQGEVVLPPR